MAFYKAFNQERLPLVVALVLRVLQRPFDKQGDIAVLCFCIFAFLLCFYGGVKTAVDDLCL